MTPEQAAAHNLKLYPWYVGGVSTYAWLPVFFLYFSDRVSLQDVLLLEAIYYFSVFALELPSGYFSDRIGRRPTLIAAASCLTLSYGLFIAADTFLLLAVAQTSLAAGLSFNSGTDTSFHLANLYTQGKQDQYVDRESRLGGLTLTVGALAALLGGASGWWDLRLAYALSGLGAIVALLTALRFHEPPHTPDADPDTSFHHSLAICIKLATTRPLAWLFTVVVASTVIHHIPYEFYQPYLARLNTGAEASTPVLAGLHMALVQLIAAPIAARSAAISARFGLRPTLLGALGLEILLIGAMAWAFHPVIALLLLGRGLAPALQRAPMRAAVAPRVATNLRATYLSMQSLCGRASFALLLLTLSHVASGSLSTLLHIAAWTALGLWVLLATTAWLGDGLSLRAKR